MERLAAALADRYRIERELGQGGMATVYLAQDLKHDRKVALKVLKPELAAVLGAERFVVEIKTTAALQHPHILPLFDSGSAHGFLYYVMPFIDGETLRSRLNRETQLAVPEAVRIASEVADALDYAHRHGVIHRDIKPENILLHDGRPMVADFGIALAVSAAAGGRMTETGLSLGTPYYMSPEQATADKEITARSDVYSLASVLYEMLAGQPPHLGGSAQQIIMKIVAEPVELVTKHRKAVPPHVAAALAQALEKLPADRFPSARAFAEALANPGYARSEDGVTARRTTGKDWRTRAAVPALGVVALLLAVLGWLVTRPRAAPAVARYEVIWPGTSFNDVGTVAVSPDGSLVVRVRRDARGDRLMLRRRDQLDLTELPGTEGASNPVFSPDNRRVAFMAGPIIRMVDLAGGPPTTVTDSAVGVPGLAWGPDGYIYYDQRGPGPLLRVPETGGAVEAVSTLDSASGEVQHVWPDVLPNGRGVVMTVNRGGPGQGAHESDGVAVLDLRTGRHRELARAVFARYAASGHLLYVTRSGVLMGAGFDPDQLQLTGPAVPLAEGVSVRTTGTGAVDLAISRGGTLWYATGTGASDRRELVWATRDGRMTPLNPPVIGAISDAAISHDGSRLAAIIRGTEGGHVWIVRPGTGVRTRLTFQRSFTTVEWSPDGRRLLANAAPGELFAVPADGTGFPQEVRADRRNVADARWAADGATILYATRSGPVPGIYEFRPGRDTASSPVITGSGVELSPSLSPDGRWLLHEVTRPTGGSGEVFVRPYPDTETSLHQISSDGGTRPRWSPNGREIFYRNRDGALVAVPVEAGPRFGIGTERVLFPMPGVSAWDVAPDGTRFLLVQDRESPTQNRLIVVENFFEELKAKVPKS